MYGGSMISGGEGDLEGLPSRLGVDGIDVEGVGNGNGDDGPGILVDDVSGIESAVDDDDDFEMREASYAIVANTNWRKRMRASRRSKCNLEGLCATAAGPSVHSTISSQIVTYLDRQSQGRLSFPLMHLPSRAPIYYRH